MQGVDPLGMWRIPVALADMLYLVFDLLLDTMSRYRTSRGARPAGTRERIRRSMSMQRRSVRREIRRRRVRTRGRAVRANTFALVETQARRRPRQLRLVPFSLPLLRALLIHKLGALVIWQSFSELGNEARCPTYDPPVMRSNSRETTARLRY